MKVCDNIIDSGKNIVFVAHAQMRKFEQPDKDGSIRQMGAACQRRHRRYSRNGQISLLFCSYKTNVVTDEKTKSKEEAR